MQPKSRFEAAAMGDVTHLALGAQNEYDSEKTGEFAFTALMYAAYYNKLTTARELVAESKLKTKIQHTISISVDGKMRFFKLQRGATALDIAILMNSQEVVDLLLEHDPQNSSLYFAVVTHNKALIDRIIQTLPMDSICNMMNYRDREDMNPVMWASVMGLVEVVQQIYDLCKDNQTLQCFFYRAVTSRAADGYTSLDYACDQNPVIAKLVHKCYVEAKDYCFKHGDYVIECAL